MTTKLTTGNFQPSALGAITGPRITNVQVTNSSYTVLDDTAVDTAGGYIKITGTNFVTGCQVMVDMTVASAVTFVSATEVTAELAAKDAGTYTVYVINPNGDTAVRIYGVTFSAAPAWVTDSTLIGDSGTAISIQLSAVDAGSYALAAGSTLPAGLSLSSDGLISGTVNINEETLYNFTVVATDAELQDSPRSFSINITVGDPQIRYVTSLITAGMNTVPFNSDASTNNFLITVVGDTKPNNFGPYTPGYYSNYFDGNGDSLTYTGGSSIAFGTSDFTIETWAYLTNTGTFTALLRPDALSTVPEWGYDFSNSSLKFDARNGAIVAASVAMPVNQWVHLAVSRAGTTLRQFINGIQVSSTNNSTSFSSTTDIIRIGGSSFSAAHGVNGYLSNFRIVNGTALYTANFTPSATPLTAITDTSLLTCQSNRFIDNSTNNFAITRNGDVKIDGFDPFVPATEFAGRGSTYFDGTGDYLTVPSNTAFNITSGSTDSFVCELWVNFSTVGANMSIVDNGGLNGVSFSNWLIYLNASNQIAIAWGSSAAPGSNIGIIPSSTVPIVGRWYHIALVKTNADWSLFIDGTRATTYNGLNTASKSSATALYIGFGINTGAGGAGFSGYISNVRIYNGATATAPYAATSTTITVPTAPLTAIANTQLLTCQTNQPNNNNMFLDSSANNSVITRFGNTTQGTFSPYGGGWSNYFDGSGDYLTAPANAQFQFTGDFTVEGWMNFSNVAGGSPQVLFGVKSGSTEFDIRWYTTRWQISLNAGSGTDIGATPAPVNGVWTHVAAVRSGSSIKLYVNGVQTATTLTNSSSLGQTGSAASVGASNTGSNIFTGYISNVRVVKGTAVYTANFTPPAAPLQPIAGTSLLTCADNRLIDDSPNNFTITRNGDVRVQKFNPFGIQTAMTPVSHSAFFDGTGDYLSLTPNSSLTLDGDYTIELWVYFTSLDTAERISANCWNTGAGWLISTQSNAWNFKSAGSFTLSYSAVAPAAGQWYHIAATRSGSSTNNVKFFINGVQVAQGTNTSTLTPAASSVGYVIGGGQGGSGQLITGYVSNFRVVKGTAVYTAAFTPATTPLTAVTNTSLLTCQSSTLVDNSTNRFAITATGDVRPRQTNPFGFTAGTKTSYSPAVYSGSMYFDGTGDYLNSATPFTIATGPFTIEAWVYLGSVGSRKMLVDNSVWSIGNNGGYRFVINASNFISLDASTGTYNSFPNLITATSSALSLVNQWYHVACTRDSSNIVRLFVNGVSAATPVTYANSLNLGSTPASRIGGVVADGTLYEPMNGYLSDVRVVSGTALYTSNFVPPVAPVQAITNTILLMNGTSAAIYDSSLVNDYETVGSVAIVTDIKPYGTGSFYFDGADYIAAPIDQPEFGFGTGDFTVELWVRNTATNSGVFFDTRRQNESRFNIQFSSSGTAVGVGISTTTILTATTGITLNAWIHVAVTKASGNYRLFINGTQAGSTVSNTTNLGTTGSFCLGTAGDVRGNDTYDFSGYLADVRVTKGFARYTDNFTAPAAPLKTK